jgi:hypothetical protein
VIDLCDFTQVRPARYLGRMGLKRHFTNRGEGLEKGQTRFECHRSDHFFSILIILVPTEAELRRTADYADDTDKKFRKSASSAQSAVKTPAYETGDALLARILTERRQNWLARRSVGEGGQGRGRYKEPAYPDTANLPPIPEDWTWAALEAVSEAVGGFAFSSTKFVHAGYQVVKMANIRMGKIDLTQRPSFISDVTSDIVEKHSLREGDLVVTLTGTRKKLDYGYVAVVKNQDGLLLNQRIARVRPFAGITLPPLAE